jgi:hypothetical protein
LVIDRLDDDLAKDSAFRHKFKPEVQTGLATHRSVPIPSFGMRTPEQGDLNRKTAKLL